MKPYDSATARKILLANLNSEQREAVSKDSRRLLVVAGAGSGKTEVMARRVAWWVAVDGVPKDQIIAFTFTDAAAEELKFRIRSWLGRVTPDPNSVSLGGMYIGTIHGFCLQILREFSPDEFYLFDVVDEAGRIAVLEQGYNGVLGLRLFQSASIEEGRSSGKFDSQNLFLQGYDLLNEYGLLDVTLPNVLPPVDASSDRDWCSESILNADVGNSELAVSFSESAARYYAYLRARRFLDFSTIQSEAVRRLKSNENFRTKFRQSWTRLVVDEVQDINPIQFELITEIVAQTGHLTAVGDHRQAIYSFRGGRVDLMGKLFLELDQAKDGHIQELPANYRSTPRIIDLSNRWSKSIRDTAGMSNPEMEHRQESRTDKSDCHVAQLKFDSRALEAEWIADTICKLVPQEEENLGAFHDSGEGSRGLELTDIAILVRSGTDIRTYQNALREKGIHAVVRGGPDLFSQPEVMLFLGALGVCSGLDEFFGSTTNPRTLPGRIHEVLGVEPIPEHIVSAAILELRARGISIAQDCDKRLLALCRAIRHRLESEGSQIEDISALNCSKECRQWLLRNRKPRRIFPQTIFHWLLRESGLANWGKGGALNDTESAWFHVGQLSSLVKSIETSGWTPAQSLKWRLIALVSWGATAARTSESPLLVSPNAVSITTIHSAKGLEFGAVFLADVCAKRFPSIRARTIPKVPFDEGSPDYVDPSGLADNENHDDERRLMYVALTRAERYLFITASGNQTSKFFKELASLVSHVGGKVSIGSLNIDDTLKYQPSSSNPENRLATSFSDLRYFMECPQDFYLRNVLGFTPTIGQEFGYGRGLHNLLRAIHASPRFWAEISTDTNILQDEVSSLVDQGMFYLRYTVGQPLENLRNRAIKGVVEYVQSYSAELAQMEFEPEKEFETLVEDENLLISGAIDVVRLDDPPRVTIIDFKSGDADLDTGTGLSHELMSMQIGLYGLAAREELEYEPQNGLIRYIGEEDEQLRQTSVDLTNEQISKVRAAVINTGKRIRIRDFNHGPSEKAPNRCPRCDFLDFCPRSDAEDARKSGV